MLQLLWKDLYLIAINRNVRTALMMFWVILLYFKNRWQADAVVAIGNVVFAFLVTVVLVAHSESDESARYQPLLFCSLPVKRAWMVYASYILTVLTTCFALGYVLLVTWLFDLIVPASFLKEHHLLTAGEAGMVMSIMLFNAVVQNPLQFRFGTMGHRKLLYGLLIVTTVIASLFLLPLFMALLGDGHLNQPVFDRFGPIAPLVYVAERLSEPGFALGTLAVFAVLCLVSIRLSVYYFENRDL